VGAAGVGADAEARARGADNFMSNVPRLYRVVIQVSDIDRAAEFYTRLLGVSGKRVAKGRHYFYCDGVILGILDPRVEGSEARPMPDHIYFSISDLEVVHAVARDLGCLASGTVHDASAGEIVERPWGERSFYAIDPFGNQLCFVDEKTIFTGVLG
jgi:predicted enzyme related to lactoylglutathione lyase